MPTPDQIRIMDDRARPRVMELWWALRPLTSVIRFMNTGAHPDDETSAMLAALGVRDGFNLSFACSTRGEGGQNDIGSELSGDLGALRTAEMERACEVLGMRMYWLSESPEDPIVDFGFSKSGNETLDRWGRDHTLARFVEIVRTERPDIICPTFLDVPGQHGHHRAMTETARLVMSAAADRDHPSNLAPWQPRKLYLPAWSGAGRSYDDDVEPPPATVVVPGKGVDPVSGWSWERIGQQSRSFHRSQGMGRWIGPSEDRDWPLHLAESRVAGPDRTPASGLPETVSDLVHVDGAEPVADRLRSAGRALDDTVSAFPDFDSVAQAAARALECIRAARDACPEDARGEILHRLDAKETQLGHVRRIALGVEARAHLGERWLYPGSRTAISLEQRTGAARSVHAVVEPPQGCTVADGTFRVGPQAASTDPYRDRFDPWMPAAPMLSLDIKAHGIKSNCCLPLDDPPVILPGRSARIEPDSEIINLAANPRRIEVAVTGVHPVSADAEPGLPQGWDLERTEGGFAVTAPENADEGLYSIPLRLDGEPAAAVRRISYPHVAATASFRRAELRVRVLSARVPDVRVGYIGSGNDRIDHWLAALGANVTAVSDDALRRTAAFRSYDTIIVGIFAMKMRLGLARAMPALHRWIRDGGTLVTLYHRPWDNWDPETIPPKRLEIGQPSLRWRVTDANSDVTHLEPAHPILVHPNRIGPDDWAGWHKERGLYFAKSWDRAYRPLIEMADPGERPHLGALLAADIGRGRHIHTSLILHHQVEKLVPGAFRLLANMMGLTRRD